MGFRLSHEKKAPNQTDDRTDSDTDRLSPHELSRRISDHFGDLHECLYLGALGKSTWRDVPGQSWRDDQGREQAADQAARQEEDQNGFDHHEPADIIRQRSRLKVSVTPVMQSFKAAAHSRKISE